MSKRIASTSASRPELLARPVKDTPPEMLARLFADGAKSRDARMVGLELELHPHTRSDHRVVGYQTMRSVLEGLAAASKLIPEREKSGEIIGLLGDGESISLEPGGQLEFASRPHHLLASLRGDLERFAGDLLAVSEPMGIEFWALGLQPYETAESAPKMPKARYRVMREYLASRGPLAMDMMHLTGSVQSTVDYGSEADLVHKVRVAAKASPFIAALAASSPFSEGRPSGFLSRRYEIWRHTDPARSGIWPEMVDAEGMTFLRYVQKALETPAMLFVRDGTCRIAEARPFSWYVKGGFEGTPVLVSDFVDHLTTLFPEVRVKSYIELRGADCLPPAYATALAGFWRALLDDEESCREAEERLAPLTFEDLRALQPRVARQGLAAQSPIGTVGDIALWLMETTHARMEETSPGCADCLLPLLERAQARSSLADEMLERASRLSLESALDLCRLDGGT